MANVYIICDDGSTESMSRLHCRDEDRELQLLLEKNPDLLPGDQIDPDNPRRWLLIKREMAVPDPNTGGDRWSIDFFFVDQDATPTFVECKRFADTRSRREVVGQMFEYAANGHHYWTKEMMRDFAEEIARKRGLTLEQAMRSLQADNGDSIDEFFSRVQENLREGQIRLVFFLDESPTELRSVVEFLNKQMERSEVLLVEARQYTRDAMKIVVPTLFGYTEEARQVKRTVTVTTRSRKQWSEAGFFADAEEKLDGASSEAVRKVYDFCLGKQCRVVWGRGVVLGSFSVVWPVLCPRPVLAIYSDGKLWLNWPNLRDNPKEEAFRDRLRERLQQVGFDLGQDTKYTSVPAKDWVPKVTQLLEVLGGLLVEFEATDT